MSNPVTPTDAQLSMITKDPYMLIALRALFDQAGTLTPDQIQELELGSAYNKANQATASIDRLASVLEMVALMPNKVHTEQDDLTPRYEIVMKDSLVDLAPV
jgi:hypothetical protein